MISRSFTAVLVDFGFATLRAKSSSSLGQAASDGARFAGGTAAYMAPELLEIRDVPAPSADIYSFGILVVRVVVQSLSNSA